MPAGVGEEGDPPPLLQPPHPLLVRIDWLEAEIDDEQRLVARLRLHKRPHLLHKALLLLVDLRLLRLVLLTLQLLST